MSYESNPAGLGVGKRYGALHLGGTAGVTCGANGEFALVAEISAEELDATPSIDMRIPEGYGYIEKVRVEVEEAFPAADAVDVFYDGVTVLTAPLVVDTLGIVAGTLAVNVIDGDVPITIDISGIAADPASGFIKVIVTIQRV